MSPIKHFRISKVRWVASFVVVITLACLLLTGCASRKGAINKSTSAEKLFSRGIKAFHAVLYDDAEMYFKAVMEDHPLSVFALDAQLMLGDIYYAKEEYEEAASYYATFISLHPSHKKSPYALFQKGMSYFNIILSADRDQTSTRKALFAFEDLLRKYPQSPYAKKSADMKVFLKNRLAEREFYIGSFYFKEKNYKGALSRFGDLLKLYPRCDLVDKALFFIARSYELIGEDGLAKETYDTLLFKYPESPYCNGLLVDKTLTNGG